MIDFKPGRLSKVPELVLPYTTMWALVYHSSNEFMHKRSVWFKAIIKESIPDPEAVGAILVAAVADEGIIEDS